MRKLLPTITHPDIVNYLLFTPSPYTADGWPEELQPTENYRPVKYVLWMGTGSPGQKIRWQVSGEMQGMYQPCYVCKLCRCTHLVSYTKCTFWLIAVNCMPCGPLQFKLFPHIILWAKTLHSLQLMYKRQK